MKNDTTDIKINDDDFLCFADKGKCLALAYRVKNKQILKWALPLLKEEWHKWAKKTWQGMKNESIDLTNVHKLFAYHFLDYLKEKVED